MWIQDVVATLLMRPSTYKILEDNDKKLLISRAKNLLSKLDSEFIEELILQGPYGIKSQAFFNSLSSSDLIASAEQFTIEIAGKPVGIDPKTLLKRNNKFASFLPSVSSYRILGNELFYHSLKHAYLSKQDFIQKISEFHGYDLDNLQRIQSQQPVTKMQYLTLPTLILTYFIYRHSGLISESLFEKYNFLISIISPLTH